MAANRKARVAAISRRKNLQEVVDDVSPADDESATVPELESNNSGPVPRPQVSSPAPINPPPAPAATVAARPVANRRRG